MKLNQNRMQWRIQALAWYKLLTLLPKSVVVLSNYINCHVNSAVHNIDHMQDIAVNILCIVISKESERSTRLDCRRANSLINPVIAEEGRVSACCAYIFISTNVTRFI
jgi:hypothetical protein